MGSKSFTTKTAHIFRPPLISRTLIYSALMNPVNNHDNGCLCEWCCALKREKALKRQRTRLVQAFAPTPSEQRALAKLNRSRAIRKSRTKRQRVCEVCEKRIVVRVDGKLYSHHNGPAWCTGGGAVRETSVVYKNTYILSAEELKTFGDWLKDPTFLMRESLDAP